MNKEQHTMNEDTLYDLQLLRDLGLDKEYLLAVGYYWTDGPLLKYYYRGGSGSISDYSTNIPLPMICSVLNAVAKEHYSSTEPHPLRIRMARYKDGKQVWEPPYCFTVTGLNYRSLCVLWGGEFTLPAGAAEVLNLSVVDRLVLTPDTQWEAVKVGRHTDVRLVRDGEFTISCGALFVPTLDVVPNAPHFSFTIKEGAGEEVLYQGTLEECFTNAKPDSLYRYDVGRERLLPSPLQ